MLEFEESFFQGETIDGFYVESDMKRAWAAQMEVLMEIDRICRKYNIQYFADTGTLLGAVRHKGYIPWDDDLDIVMKRADYQHFMKVAPKEIPSMWWLYSPHLDKTYEQPYGRLINSKGINISNEFLQQFHGCPYTVGVDIFILDYLPEEKTELEVLKDLYKYMLFVNHMVKGGIQKEVEEENKKQLEDCLLVVEEVLRFKIDRYGNIINQILIRLDQMSILYQEEECSELGNLSFMSIDFAGGVTKECYSEAVPLPFENIMIPAPIGYDEVLKALYGDYMIPVRKLDFHDYPFYKNQRAQVEEMLEKLTEINKKLLELEEGV